MGTEPRQARLMMSFKVKAQVNRHDMFGTRAWSAPVAEASADLRRLADEIDEAARRLGGMFPGDVQVYIDYGAICLYVEGEL